MVEADEHDRVEFDAVKPGCVVSMAYGANCSGANAWYGFSCCTGPSNAVAMGAIELCASWKAVSSKPGSGAGTMLLDFEDMMYQPATIRKVQAPLFKTVAGNLVLGKESVEMRGYYRGLLRT